MTDLLSLKQAAERTNKRLLELAARDPGVMEPDPAVTAAILDPEKSYVEILAAVFAGYADRPALGVRAYEIRRDPETGRNLRHYLPAYRTISYADYARNIEAVANAWRNEPEHRVEPGERVAFIAFAGAEMVAMDFATNYTQSVAVPLQANVPAESMRDMLESTEPVTMIASIEYLATSVEYALGQSTIRSLIVIDYDEADDDERESVAAARARLAEAGNKIALATFGELVAMGSEFQWQPLPRAPEGNDALTMIMFTSGSTGSPKGAMIHEAMVTQYWTQVQHAPIVAMAYAPMNHFLGRAMVWTTLAQGGTCYLTLKSDLSTLLEDIRLARPTFLTFMPRFAELIYQSFQAEVQRRIAADEKPDKADADVRAEMHGRYLGDRLISGTVGSSPTAPEVRRFIADCFDISLVDAYGSTENSGRIVTVENHVQRNLVIDYKLRDVPELGYYTTDKPYPRGELVIKTKTQFKGYWKRPDLTSEIFDENGYVLTGDIMEERGPDEIAWLDRRNNVIKLSQAEFVAIAPVEAAFSGRCPLVHQIYVYGSSYRAFLLAVVVPDMEVAQARLGREPSAEELHALILEEMQLAARQAELKSFEIPRDILVEMEPFTLENGLLTSARKPSRPALKKRYGERLEQMYQAMDLKQQEELALLRSASGASVVDRVAGAFKANLGLAVVDPASRKSYRDMGGDSLGGVGLALLLEEMFGVEVPVSMVLGPNASIQWLAAQIEAELSGEGARATFARVHGKDATEVRACDLVLDAFLGEDLLDAAATLAPPAQETSCVLMTGVTGFLGRFLALEWMERLAPGGGKVICLVRGADAADARRRLDETYGTLDPALASHFADLARDHLEVVAGDLDAPRLGLSDEDYARLADEVDQIVHPGALVNHIFSYPNLFGPNVAATADLIGLALTGRKKRFDYVSTLAVPMTNPELMARPEDTDVREAAPAMVLTDEYAMGYSASKWAGEVLLRDAHERFGLPVNVFRADMILPHSRYRGQINVPDMFTRMLHSTVQTGLAPVSFHPLENGERARAHYDGLPVDFLAAAMQQIGARPHERFDTYNTNNANHDDGISWDSFVDWVVSAGYPVDRIADYDDWFHRFSEKLRQLSDEDRHNSIINILEPYAAPTPAHPPLARSDRFVAAVAALPVGPGIPHLTEKFIHKYLDDMRAHDLIPAAGALSEAAE